MSQEEALALLTRDGHSRACLIITFGLLFDDALKQQYYLF